jgi:hypothetical protein
MEFGDGLAGSPKRDGAVDGQADGHQRVEAERGLQPAVELNSREAVITATSKGHHSPASGVCGRMTHILQHHVSDDALDSAIAYAQGHVRILRRAEWHARPVPQVDQPSDRLVQQRLRNRAMEALETLAAGDAGVRSVGYVEYFEEFFDVIDDDRPWDWRAWSTFTPDEVRALDKVLSQVLAASKATPPIMDDVAFIQSGLPIKIVHVARPALQLMQRRGRFSEEIEQEEPNAG